MLAIPRRPPSPAHDRQGLSLALPGCWGHDIGHLDCPQACCQAVAPAQEYHKRLLQDTIQLVTLSHNRFDIQITGGKTGDSVECLT